MRNVRTEGIIVKRRNIGEADRIITLFTPRYGKMTIKAAGVRKITSKRGAHIELLNRVSVSLYKGSGMHVLTEAKMIDDFVGIKEDFFRIGRAYYICELIDSLCPENQENQSVYALLQKTLAHLDTQDSASSYFHSPYQEIEEYTLGMFGLGLADETESASISVPRHHDGLLHSFELTLLSALGYWEKGKVPHASFDMQGLIESIIERRLKTRQVFMKM